MGDTPETAAGGEEKISLSLLIAPRLDGIEAHFDSEIGRVRNAMRSEIGQLRGEVRQVRDGLDTRFDTLRMFGMIVTMIVGFAAVIVSLLPGGAGHSRCGHGRRAEDQRQLADPAAA